MDADRSSVGRTVAKWRGGGGDEESEQERGRRRDRGREGGRERWREGGLERVWAPNDREIQIERGGGRESAAR